MAEVNGSQPAALSPALSGSTHAGGNGSANGNSTNNGGSNKKRRRSNDSHPTHTRALAACEACRVSKTRCDSARPVCAKCSKRGLACVYPDKDPSSMYVCLPKGNWQPEFRFHDPLGLTEWYQQFRNMGQSDPQRHRNSRPDAFRSCGKYKTDDPSTATAATLASINSASYGRGR